MRIRKFTIEGTEIKDCEGGNVEVETPKTRSGYLERLRPRLVKMSFRRNATVNPTPLLFQIMTNVDGSLRQVEGELEVEDTAGNDVGTIVFQRAHMESWRLTQRDQDVNGWEQFALLAEVNKLTAGSDNATIDVREFD